MITHATLFERFAGRDEELAHLVRLRATATRELRGRTVLVSGESGVGKSRLLREFEASAGPDRSAFVRVRCEELSVTYAPFIDALEHLEARRDIRRHEEVDGALRALTAADSGTSNDAAERQRFRLDALVSALERAAKRLGSLTLIIDDAHWSDLSSLDAMRALAAITTLVPLVLVIAYRSEDLELDTARANAFAAIEREGADRIVLEPLHFGDLTELLRAFVPDASPDVLRRIYDLSEGKPYVAEELARSIVERGGDADFEPGLTLRSAVLERVARLSPEAREVIGRAAVLGRNFAPDDVRALGATHEQMLETFRTAVDLQLVEEREVAGRPWFRFRHALTREILYRDLLIFERRALHLAIAEHLASSGHRTAELAYHLSAAGEIARAVVANERAGDEALGLAAFSDASTFFARALSYENTDTDTVARLALKLAESLECIGDFDGLLAASTRDAGTLDRAGRRDDALAILVITVRAVLAARFADALPILERANVMLHPATPCELRFAVELLNAKALRLQGRTSDSLVACKRAEAALRRPTPRQQSELLLSQANTYLRLNDLERAESALAARLAIRGTGTSVTSAVDDAQAAATTSLLTFRKGDIRSAFERSLEAAVLWERAGYTRSARRLRSNGAYFAAELGDFAFVRQLAEHCRRDGLEREESLLGARVRVARATGDDPARYLRWFEKALGTSTIYLIYALARDLPWMLCDDRQRARAIAIRGLEAIPAPDVEADLLEALVEFGTEDDVARAIEILEGTSFNKHDVLHGTDAALVRARVALRGHRRLEAMEFARSAVEGARKTGQWLPLANALFMLGEPREAREILVRVGASGELARLERTAHAGEKRDVVAVAKLTGREEQIARLIASGLSSREAAERLDIASRTVETHLANVYAKLAIKTRAELASHFA